MASSWPVFIFQYSALIPYSNNLPRFLSTSDISNEKLGNPKLETAWLVHSKQTLWMLKIHHRQVFFIDILKSKVSWWFGIIKGYKIEEILNSGRCSAKCINVATNALNANMALFSIGQWHCRMLLVAK